MPCTSRSAWCPPIVTPSGRARLVDLAPSGETSVLRRPARPQQPRAGTAHERWRTGPPDHASEVRRAEDVHCGGGRKFTPEDARQLQEGVFLAEGKAKANSVKIKSSRGKSTLLEIELREGKNREIRRIMAKLEHKVLTLKRIAIGSLRLGDMPEGSYRILSRQEIAALRRGSDGGAKKAPRKGKVSKKKKPAPTVEFEDSLDEDWDEDDLGDDLVEIRDESPRGRAGGGAVIGGDQAPRGGRKKAVRKKKGVRKKKREVRGGRPAKPAAKKKARGKPVRKKAVRSGRPKKKRR